MRLGPPFRHCDLTSQVSRSPWARPQTLESIYLLRSSEELKWSVRPELIIFIPTALRTHYANAQIQFIVPAGLGLGSEPRGGVSWVPQVFRAGPLASQSRLKLTGGAFTGP